MSSKKSKNTSFKKDLARKIDLIIIKEVRSKIYHLDDENKKINTMDLHPTSEENVFAEIVDIINNKLNLQILDGNFSLINNFFITS